MLWIANLKRWSLWTPITHSPNSPAKSFWGMKLCKISRSNCYKNSKNVSNRRWNLMPVLKIRKRWGKNTKRWKRKSSSISTSQALMRQKLKTLLNQFSPKNQFLTNRDKNLNFSMNKPLKTCNQFKDKNF